MGFREKEAFSNPDTWETGTEVWIGIHVFYPFSFLEAEAEITVEKSTALRGGGKEKVTVRAALLPEGGKWYCASRDGGSPGVPFRFTKGEAYGRVSCTAVFRYRNRENVQVSEVIYDSFCFRIQPEQQGKGDYSIERRTTVIPDIMEGGDVEIRTRILRRHGEVLQGKAVMEGKHLYNMPVYVRKIKAGGKLGKDSMIDTARKVLASSLDAGLVKRSGMVLLNIFIDHDIYLPDDEGSRKASGDGPGKETARPLDLGTFFT